MGVRVREKPPGSGVWWVFVNHKGRRKSKRVGSEAAALQAAEKIQARITLGEFKVEKLRGQKDTFKAIAKRWLSLPHERKGKRGRKESTIESYRFSLERYVFPVIGKTHVTDLSRRTLKELFEKMERKGLSPGTLNVVQAVINNVLEYAMDLELIEHNAMRDVRLDLGRSKALEVDPLSEAEAAGLLKAAKGFLGGYYYASILCALRTGMRIGEMEALQVGDIDFNGRFIEVRRSHRRGRVTDTKNRKRRQVDMTPHLAETLKALLTTHKRRALREGRPVPEWVFASRTGGMLNRDTFKNALEACLKAARLRRIRVHDLRHTYATTRLLRGHNIGDVSYQLGHSRISITYDVYAHWIPGRFKSEVNDLDTPAKTETAEAHPNRTPGAPGEKVSGIS